MNKEARSGKVQRIAVIGAGISGLASAWLLSRRHDVTLYEAETRLGGHSNTVEADGVPVDTGFIVYNAPAYPNLTALFQHLNVPNQASDMSFSVSLDNGALEYAGTDFAGLFAQKRNLLRPRFWSMLAQLLRFYRAAPRAADLNDISLRDFLSAGGYSDAFLHDHLYPMIAAVWSCPAAEAGDLPAAAFIRFCENHGLLKITGRPVWRTVTGGSREYVKRLRADFRGRVLRGMPVLGLRRIGMEDGGGVELREASGSLVRYDHAVLACHANQALQMLDDPSSAEREILGSFRYTSNLAVLHRDPSVMPRRRAAWAAWNFTGGRDEGAPVCVTYWMNRLQNLETQSQLFVTLNPDREPQNIAMCQTYEHPVFDVGAMRAQAQLWSLQGTQQTWFCGAYFGAGFHEDGLQAGLAVAEALGAPKRPWHVADESGRIQLPVLQSLAA
jgi:predicted NAD/FAD-binding protein